MTYRDLLYKATRLCDKGEITLGEYEEMTKPLDREVEQEPFKPMVEIDLYSVIKQKYIERDVLDKIRAEIKERTSNRGFLSCQISEIHGAIDAIFDKYIAESED